MYSTGHFLCLYSTVPFTWGETLTVTTNQMLVSFGCGCEVPRETKQTIMREIQFEGLSTILDETLAVPLFHNCRRHMKTVCRAHTGAWTFPLPCCSTQDGTLCSSHHCDATFLWNIFDWTWFYLAASELHLHRNVSNLRDFIFFTCKKLKQPLHSSEDHLIQTSRVGLFSHL